MTQTISVENRGRLTAAGFIGLYLHGIVVAMPGAFLGQWTDSFGKSVNIGLFYTLFLVSSFVGLAWVSRQKYRHPLFALAFASIGFAFIMAGLAPTFRWIAGAALLFGFGDGMLNFHANNLVGELHPRHRITVLNWANATFGLGALSAPLINAALPWRGAFYLVAGATILATALAWQAPPVQNFRPSQDQIQWQLARPFLLLILLYVGLESSIGTWSGSYLNSLGWNKDWQSALLAAYWGGLTLGRMTLSAWVAPQPVQRLKVLLLMGMGAIALTSLPSFGFIFAIAAFLYGPTFATLFALLQERCGHVALGYLFYGAYLGKTLIPAGLDQISNPLDLRYGFLGLALLLYLSSLLLPRASAHQHGP
ncbi:MAG: MFS transporter [Acaryochloridaceae cyanobacterium SU_2_1]|nr:MFS transporter [Acaryochloridaceae cyanobacterium SU_2_1]